MYIYIDLFVYNFIYNLSITTFIYNLPIDLSIDRLLTFLPIYSSISPPIYISKDLPILYTHLSFSVLSPCLSVRDLFFFFCTARTSLKRSKSQISIIIYYLSKSEFTDLPPLFVNLPSTYHSYALHSKDHGSKEERHLFNIGDVILVSDV